MSSAISGTKNVLILGKKIVANSIAATPRRTCSPAHTMKSVFPTEVSAQQQQPSASLTTAATKTASANRSSATITKNLR